MKSDLNDPDFEIGFCGDPFWDNFQPLYNRTSGLPILTECFQHTVLIAIPCFFFWLLLPILFTQLKLSRQEPLPWTTIQSMKWLVLTLLIIDRAFVLVLSIFNKFWLKNPVPTVNLVYPIVQTATFAMLSFMKNECRRRGIRSSGVLFCTWLLFAFFGAPEFYTWIVIGSSKELVAETDFFKYLSYLVYYPLVLIQLFLMCFADPLTLFKDDQNKKDPYATASFLNRQFFWWFSPMVSLGFKRPLMIDDVYDVDEELKPDYLQKIWKEEWDVEMKRFRQEMATYVSHEKLDADIEERNKTDEKTLLLQSTSKSYGGTRNGEMKEIKEKAKKDPNSPKQPSIVWCLWRLFKWELIAATALKLISDLMQFLNPLLLNLLITFTEDQSAPWYEGLVYAFGLGLSNLVRSQLMNQYFTEMFRVGQQFQAVLTTAVYEKTLCLSNTARREKTVGEIVNLMAIDVERFKSIAPQLQQYWSSPMTIILCLLFLTQTVGWAALMGVIIMALVIPVNFWVSFKCREWQVEQLRLKDQRIKMTNEVLNGIKVVKLYAWEPAMEKAIDKIREKEMKLVQRASTLQNTCDIFNVSQPFFVAAATFATYTLTDPSHILTPQIAFVSLTLFNSLRGPLMMAADLISQTVQAIVSNKRLKDFLIAEELNETSVDRQLNSEFYEKSLQAQQITWTWDRSLQPALRDIDIEVPSGKLIAVVGTVGAGKSSLLSGVLGEMEKLRGYVGVRGTVAYVSQQPWIQNLTLRDNILMGKDFNKLIYDMVVEACALKPDLELLPAGDSTEIGEKGINLSGGQKARVALARAVYQDRDIILLDDPLSAVDAHVAKHIFDQVIGPNGVLKSKTRVLVTHGLSFLKEADIIAIVKDNTIAYVDTYANLMENPETERYLQEAEIEKKEEEESEIEESSDEESQEKKDSSDAESEIEKKSTFSKASTKLSKKSRRSSAKRSQAPIRTLPQEADSKLIVTEKAETGRVKPQVYMNYFKAMGLITHMLPLFIFIFLWMGFSASRSLWLSAWSDSNLVPGQDPLSLGARLGIFTALGFLEIFSLFVSFYCLLMGGIKASLQLHTPLLHNVLRSPLSFFDVTPLGRILNRLGKDIEVIDLRLPGTFRFVVISAVNVIQVVILITIALPLFMIVAIPVFVIYFLLLRYIITCSRQLQRLASITRSPIYSHFGESIQGASTIRAFGWTDNFIEMSKQKLEVYIRCSYFTMIAQRWFSVRLELLGNVIILGAALLAIVAKNWGLTTAGMSGLAVSYSLNVTFMMSMFVRYIGDLESNVVSVERVKEYTENQSEANWEGEKELPRIWPDKGDIQFKKVRARYRPGLDLVLRDLSAHISPGEKVGIVGRTGAGKSSMALVLFRIVEPCGGVIQLDGIDIQSLGLHDLRKNITIIPQDPVLFSGTLRFNLDPTEDHSDAELWAALEHAHLKNFIEMLPSRLDHQIDEGGENISVGQRQLVCLTRALLRKSKVLVLDEATAAVDVHTDALIQSTIRREFAAATILTIAHRLNTIMDYDKIMVMKSGEVAEMGSPQQLLQNKESVFYNMAQSAGLV
ncbi:unnamed protein product, partial [Mesorhabditis belari]|uniref:ABC-type glutathione-S-conjugate transporter n=1 Tax=Mesorhabditis belari TaxID=2138241 RepID=A0AAF3FL35_9BILA